MSLNKYRCFDFDGRRCNSTSSHHDRETDAALFQFFTQCRTGLDPMAEESVLLKLGKCPTLHRPGACGRVYIILSPLLFANCVRTCPYPNTTHCNLMNNTPSCARFRTLELIHDHIRRETKFSRLFLLSQLHRGP